MADLFGWMRPALSLETHPRGIVSLTFLAALAAAFVAGTFFEYVIHRWFAHGALAGTSTGSLTRHRWVHHKVFTERRGMTAERGSARREHVHLSFGALAMMLLLLVAGAAAAGLLIAGDLEGAPVIAGGIAAGLLLTIVIYDLVHWMHHAELPRLVARMPIYKQLRAWHFAHHEEPDSRYATLLPLWDVLFFTRTAGELLEPEEAPEKVDTRPKTRRPASREQAQTRIQGMMEQAAAAAESNLDDQEKPARRRGFFGGGGTDEKSKKETTSPRTRGVTDNQKAVDAAAKDEERAKSAPAQTKKPRGRRAGQRKGAKTTADWLASIDVGDNLDIKVTAVKEEDE